MDFQLSLASEPVRSAAPAAPLAATSDTSIGMVMELMRAEHVGVALLFEDEKLSGIFTERDALRVMQSGRDLSVPVASVMSTDVTTLASSDSIGEAIRAMSQGGYRHLPILDSDGQPSGLLSVREIVHFLVQMFPDTIYNLPPTPNQVQAEREGA